MILFYPLSMRFSSVLLIVDFFLDDPALAGITILAMTANAFDEDRKKALACGMDGFLSKPIVIEELISTLQNSLG